jgi:gliding motility-associated-like protein
VTGTDGNGCVNTATKSITVNALPTVTATSTPSSGAVCIGDNATLNGSGASSYTWSGGITNGTAFAPTTTTSYTVTGTDANGCVNTAAKSITVNALPTAAAIIASDNKVMEGSTLNLTAAASGGTAAYTYTWVPNSTINYNIIGGANALFNALKEGSVSIKYQVKDANNCLAQSTDFTITIAPLLFIFEVPNAFTPNGDGLNDELKIISNAGISSLTSFKIFSRSGNLVFESRSLSTGWNGIYKNNLLPADIYYWTAVYVDINNQTKPKTGTVLLLK